MWFGFLIFIIEILLSMESHLFLAETPFDDRLQILNADVKTPPSWDGKTFILQGNNGPFISQSPLVQNDRGQNQLPEGGMPLVKGKWMPIDDEQDTPSQEDRTSPLIHLSRNDVTSDPSTTTTTATGAYFNQVQLTIRLLERVNGERISKGLSPLCANRCVCF